MPWVFPDGFQVGGRAVRDKVTGGAGFATNVGKDAEALTRSPRQLQDCARGRG
jgi:hypothetical protein